MQLDFSTLSANDIYKLVSYSIFPRPIAWIVTEDGGVVNLAPFSYFAPMTSKPPVAIVSIGQKEDGSPKDTLANLLKTKKATICIANKTHADFVSKSAEPLPKSISECTHFSIPTQRIREDFPPIVQGVHAAFFATLREVHPIEGSTTTPVFVNLEGAYYEDGVIDEGLHVTMEALGRMGKYYLIDPTYQEA